jgi:hypothetical protein
VFECDFACGQHRYRDIAPYTDNPRRVQQQHQHHINNKHTSSRATTPGQVETNAGMYDERVCTYATLPQPTTPAAGSRDEAVSSPSASSLAIPSQSCALFNTQGTAQAQKCFCAAKHPRRHARTVLAIILTASPLNSDRLMIHNLTRPSRSRRNSGRIPF